MAELNFDATNVVPATGKQEAIPAGWYNAAMVSSEMKLTKDKMGSYLECIFNILDGPHVGGKLYSRLNLRNNNTAAVEIAYGELSAICHAVGIMQVQDSSHLHGKPLKLKVIIGPTTEQYPDANNEIRAYKPIDYNPDAASTGSPKMATPVAPPVQNQQPVAPVQAPVEPVQQPAVQPVQQPAPVQVNEQQWAQPPVQPAQNANPPVQPAAPVNQQAVAAQNANPPWNQPPASPTAGQ